MPRPLRLFEPNQLYFVTNRCFQGRLLMRPSKKVNLLIGGILAKAQKRFGIQIYGYVFMSNHYHMMISGEEGVISDFVAYFQSFIAKKIGKLHGWKGKFWHRRFSAEPILDDEACIERLRYILAHGVKESLVKKAEDWPGLTCIPQLLHSKPRSFSFYNGAAHNKAQLRGVKAAKKDYVEEHSIVLSSLPGWKRLSKAQRQTHIKKMLKYINASSLAQVKQAFMGIQKIRRQHPHSRPKTLKESPRPLCHGSCHELRRAYREKYRAFVGAYREAVKRLKMGAIHFLFPRYAYPPPLPKLLLAA